MKNKSPTRRLRKKLYFLTAYSTGSSPSDIRIIPWKNTPSLNPNRFSPACLTTIIHDYMQFHCKVYPKQPTEWSKGTEYKSTTKVFQCAVIRLFKSNEKRTTKERRYKVVAKHACFVVLVLSATLIFHYHSGLGISIGFNFRDDSHYLSDIGPATMLTF